MVRIGIIGGSGLYEMEGVEKIREEHVPTPFGEASDKFSICVVIDKDTGKPVEGVELVFMPRHGYGHRLLPTEVNSRANIFGMKVLGVEWIIAVSAVGSLREEIDKGHIVLVDQFIDKTRHRKDTFFGEGIAAHVPFGDPVCGTLHGMLHESCKERGVTVHPAGTYVNMEGPAFSTRAESNLHRSWGAQVIGMTVAAEAKLCREAEISYAVMAMATDYDCWAEEVVSVEEVVKTMTGNVQKAQDVVLRTIPKIKAFSGKHPMHDAMSGAIMTAPAFMPAARVIALAPLLKKYVEIPSASELIPWGRIAVAAGVLALGYATFVRK